jgi:hypothetical protein
MSTCRDRRSQAAAHVTAREARDASKYFFCCTFSRNIMHRVCRDPLQPVQARFLPPDDLFGGCFPPPQFSKKNGNLAITKHQNGVS